MSPDELEAIKSMWLSQCGPCDYGMPEYGCSHPREDYRPVMMQLVREIERLRGERENRSWATVHERMVWRHDIGAHDDSDYPYAHCALCEVSHQHSPFMELVDAVSQLVQHNSAIHAEHDHGARERNLMHALTETFELYCEARGDGLLALDDVEDPDDARP